MAAATRCSSWSSRAAPWWSPDGCYLGVAAAFEHAPPGYGWTLRRVDIADTEAVLAAAEGADLVWMESPTNPMMEVADLPPIAAELTGRRPTGGGQHVRHPAAAAAARTRGRHRVHSATKMISGHSDVLLGAVVTAGRPDTFAALAAVRHDCSARFPGRWRPTWRCAGCGRCRSGWRRPRPMRELLADGWPGIRPSGGCAIPGCPTIRDTACARRTMSGFGSLISIELADAATADALVAGLPTVGLRHQSRRRGVDAGAPSPLAGRTADRARGAGPAVGRHRARRGPVGRPRPGPRLPLLAGPCGFERYVRNSRCTHDATCVLRQDQT